jgi:hypothetical protein
VKEYIERGAALEGKVPHHSANGVEIVESKAIPVEYIENLPAAGVVPVDREFELAIIGAERYACGRRTYIVGATVDYIISLLPKLSDWCVAILRRDLQDQQAMVERTGDKRLWGDECDEIAWARLIAALDENLGRGCER